MVVAIRRGRAVLIVAVTGGIGAGKSTVSRMLADRGAIVIDSDRLAREVVEPGTDGFAEVVAAFGDGVVADDGALDRAALAAIVFADTDARTRLERIVHPRVRAAFHARRDAAPPDAIVVNDIPLVRTDDDAAAFDRVVVVVADLDTRLTRLVGRGMTEADARARIAAQPDDAERVRFAHRVIDNNADESALAGEVARLWADLRAAADHA